MEKGNGISLLHRIGFWVAWSSCAPGFFVSLLVDVVAYLSGEAALEDLE
jgi:hypothetical protein